MRDETSPAPIYEGEDGVIAWLLDGPDASYRVPLPAPGEPKRAILRTYTKEYSAEYQAQAFIDLAKRLRTRIPDLSQVRSITIYTSHHTHFVIGTGSGDPQKFDPRATRETLDHSLPYIFAVALEDGAWDHEKSYAEARRTRPGTVALWRKITTEEDPAWTDRYLSGKAFGGRAVVLLGAGERGGAKTDGPKGGGGRVKRWRAKRGRAKRGRAKWGRAKRWRAKRDSGRGRDHCGRRPPARRQAFRPTAVPGEVPTAGFGDGTRAGARALPGAGPAPARARARGGPRPDFLGAGA